MLTDRLGGVSEAALRVTEADHRDQSRAEAVVSRTNQSAGGWRQTEAAKVRARDVLAGREIGLPMNLEIEPARVIEGENARED